MAETLGQLLKNLAGIEGTDAKSEPIASTNAFIPGYPKKEMVDAVDAGSETRSPEAGFDIHDISLGAKKALAQYTAGRLIEGSTSNAYPQLAVQDGAVGHSKEDSLRKQPADGSSFYEPGYLGNAGKTNYRPSDPTEGSDLEKLRDLIDDKRVRADKTSLGSMLKGLNVPLETTFGRKMSAHGSENSVTEDAISEAAFNLLKDNKYNPGGSTPFLKTPGTGRGDDQISKGMYSLYTGLLGKSTTEDGGHPKGVTVADLQRAALDLLHRAQGVGDGKAREVADAIASKGSPFTGIGDILAAIPHVTQVGAGTVPGGVNRLRIRATDAMQKFSQLQAAGQDDLIAVESFDTVLGVGGSEDPILSSVSMNAKSFGTMNSPSEPFNGVAPFGMILPVIYAIIILGLLGLALGAIIAGFASINGFKQLDAESPWSLAMGLNAPEGTNWTGAEIGQKFLNMFGLPGDVGMEFLSMVRGIMLFYGIDINPFQPGAALADAFINLLMGPGYYLVISKKVLADFDQITRAFANYTNISGINAITIILASLEALMSSFTVRWCVIMNTIGRIDEDGRIRRGEKAHGQSVMSVMEEKDAKTVVTPTNRNKMSRWYPRDGSNAMSPLSARLFSAAFLTAENMASPGALAHPASIVGPTVQSRISPQTRDYIESRIDSEYMPFSIHDLRTNEVISLPAFISSVTDDFSVDYNSTHGFGRTDEVKTYRKTNRNVGFSFHLVAMNPEDHDYIWYVANRFVSMVYPQRDSGRKRRIPMSDGKFMEFTQPFSQAITASPVVRIRLGDVFASNVSRSGFAQIFGNPKVLKESSNSSPEAQKTAAELDTARSALKQLSEIHKDHNLEMLRESYGANDPARKVVTPPGVSNIILAKGATAYVVIDKKTFAFKTQYTLELPASAPRVNEAAGKNIKKAKVAHEYSLEGKITDRKDAFALGGAPLLAAFDAASSTLSIPNPFSSGPKGPKMRVPYTQKDFVSIDDSSVTIKALRDGNFPRDEIVKRRLKKMGLDSDNDTAPEWHSNYLTISSDIIDLEVDAEALVKDSSYDDVEHATAIDNFMSPSINPVVRSFEAAGGRGLAGVITQLTFDYNDALWGTGDPESGLRAPMMINISVVFSPIHDLPLGLNHRGEMFAPSHPVGVLSAAKLDKQFKETVSQRIAREQAQARSAISSLPDVSNPAEIKLPF